MTKMMMTMTFFVIHCLNIDNDNVQKLGNFSIGIANGHSWLLITPFHGLLLYVLAWRKVRWLASYFKIYRQSLVKIIFGNFSTNFISRQNYLTSHFPALMNVIDQSSTTLGFSPMKKLETRTHSRLSRYALRERIKVKSSLLNVIFTKLKNIQIKQETTSQLSTVY